MEAKQYVDGDLVATACAGLSTFSARLLLAIRVVFIDKPLALHMFPVV